MNRAVALLIIIAIMLLAVPPVAADDEARILLSQGILSYLRDGGKAVSLADLRDAALRYPEYPRQITDTTGSRFILYRPVGRIVVLHINAAEAAITLGADELIVGVSESIQSNTDQFPKLSLLPGIGRWVEPDIETILALNPDLVLTYVQWPDPDKLDRHLPSRIPVIRMDLYRAETFREEMQSLGRLLNRDQELADYLAWHDANLDLVRDRIAMIPENDRVRIYAEAGRGQSFGRRAYSEGTGLHDLIIGAGGVNVASGHFTGYADVENEWVLHQNPDLILIWTGRGGYKTEHRDEIIQLRNDIMGVPGFHRIHAVRDERVYVITSGFAYGTISPATIVQLACWFYPDEFSDIDAGAIFEEYLKRYTEAGSDIRDRGTFTYPDGRA